MYELYKRYLSVLTNAGKYRRLGDSRQGNQGNCLNFSTNDYLGLKYNADIIEASIKAVKNYGIGATGSRILSGNNDLFEAFENSIAMDKNTEAALIFSTGFQANFSTLVALLDKKVLGAKPIVFFDMLNHSSLYQAIFASEVELVRYQHNDMTILEQKLLKYKDDSRPKFIITETVFGMDGDVVPLEKIALLAKKHKAFLYLDEAHATGIFGPRGYGVSTILDLSDIPHIIMGTFSKALGCSGGYIACSKVLQEYLINRAAGFIYSTAPSPSTIGAAFEAWKMIPIMQEKREKLLYLSDMLKQHLLELKLDIGNSTTHIIPVILKDENITMNFKKQLFEKNIIVSAIRPPTVPPNTSRIRIALTTEHNEQGVEKLVNTLKNLL